MRLKDKSDQIEDILSQNFKDSLVSTEAIKSEKKQARKVQKIDDGIEAQKKVLEKSATQWNTLLQQGHAKGLLTQKEIEIISVATQLPKKIPTEKQSLVLMDLLERVKGEGVAV